MVATLIPVGTGNNNIYKGQRTFCFFSNFTIVPSSTSQIISPFNNGAPALDAYSSNWFSMLDSTSYEQRGIKYQGNIKIEVFATEFDGQIILVDQISAYSNDKDFGGQFLYNYPLALQGTTNIAQDIVLSFTELSSCSSLIVTNATVISNLSIVITTQSSSLVGGLVV